MNWQQFIIRLLDYDLRLSSLEVEKRTSIRQQIVDRWKRGGIDKPHRNTIRRLEAGLSIRINDTDPENITYRVVQSYDTLPAETATTQQMHFSDTQQSTEIVLPIEANIPAGPGSFTPANDIISLQFDTAHQFALKIDRYNGESMQPFLHPGDIVICDMRAGVQIGDIVAARWNNEQAAVKVLGDSSHVPDSFLLYSYNPVVRPIIVKKSEARLYRVVFIKKQH